MKYVLPTLTQLQTIFALQDKVNSSVDANWTTQGRNWNLALKAELFEAIDHLNWEWWKNKDKVELEEKDKDQFILEFADGTAFILGEMIVNGVRPSDLDGYFAMASEFDVVRHYVTATSLSEMILGFIERDIDSAYGKYLDFFYLIAVVGKIAGFDWNEVYKKYLAKSVLNIFRQQNGYKQGTYLKNHWDGQEDNVFLSSVVNSLSVDEITEESLLGILTEKYRKVKLAFALTDIDAVSDDREKTKSDINEMPRLRTIDDLGPSANDDSDDAADGEALRKIIRERESNPNRVDVKVDIDKDL